MKSTTIIRVTIGAIVCCFGGAASAQVPYWDAIPPYLYQAGVGHAVATPRDGKLYVIGEGAAAGLASKKVIRYSPLTGLIESGPAVAQLPNFRCEHSAVTGTDGRIYVIGGRVGPGHPPITSSVLAYAPGDTVWSPVASLNIPRVKPAVVTGKDGLIYAFGGTDNFGAPILTAERLNPLALVPAWSMVMSGAAEFELPFGSGWKATAGHDGAIYLFSTTDQYSFDSATAILTPICSSCFSPTGFTITTGQDGLIYRISPGGTSDVFTAPAMTQGLASPMIWSYQQPEAAAAEGSIYSIGTQGELYDPLRAVIAQSTNMAFLRFDTNFGSSGCPVTQVSGSAALVWPGRVNGAASFNASPIGYQASSCFNVGAGSFSIDFWIRHAQPSGTKSVLDYRDSVSRGYHVALYSGKILLQMANSAGTYYNYLSTVQIPANQWTHVAFTVDRKSTPSKGSIWLNGAFSGSFTPLAGNLDSSGPMRIGSHRDYSSYAFKGDLDELQIHGKALTWNEVRSIFLAGRQGKN